MADDINIKGGAELDAFLKTLPAKVEANILRSALRAGMLPIQAEAKSKVAVASGLLRDGLKVSTKSRRGVVTSTLRTTGKHAYLANWIEYGTAAHKIVAKLGGSLFFGGIFLKGIDHPGSKAKPFMRPALDTKAMEAVAAVAAKIRQRLTKQGIDTKDSEALQ